jgi:Pyridoxamine 5'-phosphate oxidase
MTPAPQNPEPASSRPRMFGGHLEPVRLPWKWAEAQLGAARTYWIATTRADGRPHTRPVWGIWLDAVLYLTIGSPLAEQNLARTPAATVHLESGAKVVILEGPAEAVTEPSLLAQIIPAYEAKYQWKWLPDDRPYAFRPQVGFGWLSEDDGLDGGSVFRGTATRWTFPPARGVTGMVQG